MAPIKHSEKVPKAMEKKYASIIAITDDFAKKHLDEEYAQLIRYATAALARKRPSPLAKGQAKSWACGITHAIGMVNFLYDSSFEPHIKASDLYKAFGVGQSTGQGKSKLVRDMLDTHQMDPNWCVPSMMDQNPLANLAMLNGMIVDISNAPPEMRALIQAQRGLYPQPQVEVPSRKRQSSPRQPIKPGSPKALYTLEVLLIGGPVEAEFLEANPQILRMIEIPGKQTLADLHEAIFQAFDRDDPHMYEFQVRGDRPQDPDAERYGLAEFGAEDLDGDVEETTIAELGLVEADVFGYWFDFGDDWWHRIEIVAVQPKTPKGKYPKITERIGASPPQYPEED